MNKVIHGKTVKYPIAIPLLIASVKSFLLLGKLTLYEKKTADLLFESFEKKLVVLGIFEFREHLMIDTFLRKIIQFQKLDQ